MESKTVTEITGIMSGASVASFVAERDHPIAALIVGGVGFVLIGANKLRKVIRDRRATMSMAPELTSQDKTVMKRQRRR